jgi:tetraprenyl-beta-curcumene synthase
MAQAAASDPTPLTPAQVRALVAATTRELTWGLLRASRELRKWHDLAELIPDAPTRDDALRSLRRKRGHAFGAALFSVLPERRDRTLLRLIVAWETILDYLDNVHERHPTEENGEALHKAPLEALDPTRPTSDYYRLHPWQDDGGYLRALVEACRSCCRALPSYERVRPLIVAEAERLDVLGLNHLTDPAQRDPALERWAYEQFPDRHGLYWYELTASASSSLVVLPLLALATRTTVSDEEIAATHRAYWPWISLVNIMLDAYADQAEDAISGNHSYVAHYPDHEMMVERLAMAVSQAIRHALELPTGISTP